LAEEEGKSMGFEKISCTYPRFLRASIIIDNMAKPLIGPDWRLYQIGHLQ
jgi:hypothetical protein